MTNEKYNGWTNRPTWQTMALIDNDEEMYIHYWYVVQKHRDVKEMVEILQKTVYQYDIIREHITRGEFLQVNWEEIATAMVDEWKD